MRLDIQVTTGEGDADIVYDGRGYPCQYDWGAYMRDVWVEQRTEYKGRRHLVLALLAEGATSIRWIDCLEKKLHIFTHDDIDSLID